MISVVIPAHNEEAVVGDLLGALGPGIDAGRLEVVVVPNGCSDDTATVARAHSVTVVERDQSGKPGALNAGDAAVTAFPRFYIDADVVVTAADLEILAAALGGEVLAVAPARRVDSTASSWPVRAYHRIWDQLESTSASLAGRGCYGVSEQGRSRWGDFPDLTADDGFVNSLFDLGERVNVASVCSVVHAPPDVRRLLQRKRRSHRGNLELEQRGVAVTSSLGWLSVIRRQPARILDAPAYVAISLASRWLARRDARSGSTAWGDHRTGPGGGA